MHGCLNVCAMICGSWLKALENMTYFYLFIANVDFEGFFILTLSRLHNDLKGKVYRNLMWQRCTEQLANLAIFQKVNCWQEYKSFSILYPFDKQRTSRQSLHSIKPSIRDANKIVGEDLVNIWSRRGDVNDFVQQHST